MQFQWYPGHMTKAKRMMEEEIKLVDLVIELVDARIPFSSRNPEIDKIGKNKARLILLNKSDLADQTKNISWMKWFEDQGYFTAMVNSKSGAGIKDINKVIKEACQEKIERDKRRGILNRPVRAMVVGIPNVGKSTFINSYARKACTKTGNKPGVTKGKQWIKLSKTLELLDTPGILWPKFEDQAVGLRLAMIGSIKDDILNIVELSMEVLTFMQKKYSGMIEKRYGIEEKVNPLDTLHEIAKVRHCLLKGNAYDINKAASIVLEEFRNGKIGRISLEVPEV